MSFYGAVVHPGKSHPFVPPPEHWNLHLSQAALPPTVTPGERVALCVTQGEGEQPIILCTLTAKQCDTAALDIFLSQYAEFSVLGKSEVHISGYYSPAPPDLSDDEDGEDEDEDEYAPNGGMVLHGHDSDDMEDDEDELDEDEDDEDEDDDLDIDDDDEVFGYPGKRKKPHVVIEELPNDKAQDQGKAAAAPAGKKQQPKQQQQPVESEEDEDEDDEMEDGDEDEGEDDEDEEGEDEDEDEDEEDEPQPQRRPGEKRPTAPAPAAAQPQAKKGAQQQKQQEQPKAANGKQQQQQTPGRKQQQQATPGSKQQTPGNKQQQTPAKPEVKSEAKPAAKAEAKGEKGQEAKAAEAKAQLKPSKKEIRRFENGFEYEQVAYGPPHGKLAKPGAKVSVRYTGRLKSNGKKFDSSGAKPFTFRLGVGEVIKGWDAGVAGMKVGDKRRLVIPPQMAYGSSGVRGTIPPNATLEFDVELVDVKGM